MIATFKPYKLNGIAQTPSSKSVSHRLLIIASMVKEKSTLKNVLFCNDIDRTIDCLRLMGSNIEIVGNDVIVDGTNFLSNVSEDLYVDESGSTLRFLLPFALLCYKDIKFHGTNRLMEKPMDVLKQLCVENNFIFEKHPEYVLVNGGLHKGEYSIAANTNTQFLSGLIMALAFHNQDSTIEFTTDIESYDYLKLTIDCLAQFGYFVELIANKVIVHPCIPHSNDIYVEADESNCANLDAYNYIGSNIELAGLDQNMFNRSRIYKQNIELITNGKCEIDIKDSINLGPLYMALAALKKGVVLINSAKLTNKESNRAFQMKTELAKTGTEVIISDNSIEVIPHPITLSNFRFEGYRDHRIIMALSLILSKYGGTITDFETVDKSFPDYMNIINKLGGKITINN